MKILDAQESGFAPLWSALLHSHDNPTAFISQLHFDYQALYLGPALERWIGIVVAEGDRPVAGASFELLRDASSRTLAATSAPSATIFARGIPQSQRAGAETLLRKRIDGLLQETAADRFVFVDQTIGGGLSTLTHWALGQGATIESRFNQIIDLTQDEAELWRGLTKSCQWGVNWGRKNMVLQVGTDAAALEQLRRLHLEAAGQATRDPATWEIQRKMLEAGEAFIVTGQIGGAAVSAALFDVSDSDCYYGVSASDRRLFDKPISHAIIWEAIRHARQKGCVRFNVGGQVWERARPHLPPPSPKEVNIARFKRSFGGTSRPEFVVDLPLTPRGPSAEQ